MILSNFIKNKMEQIKKIAVIGGTGKSGKYLVKQLLDQGFHIKMLVRNPERRPIQNASVEVITGDVTDYERVHTLVDGCDAVMSTLGLGLPPSEPTIFSLAARHITQAMDACGVRRYIVVTGLNVDVPSDQKGHKTKSATDWMYANYPKSTADKQLEYRILSESKLDWTLVRLPLIEQTDARAIVSISLEDCPGDKISATDLAHFFIEQLTDNTYIRKAPFIANV
ncbi:MAG: SDR family oxidoreductase [Cyclobacteriaceae bacterium]